MTTTQPIASAILAQLAAIARQHPAPRVRCLHIPHRSETAGELDAEFCAIELDDGAFGLSYVLLGDTLDAMLATATQATHFAVIGPSAGLWPDALFDRGVTLLGGTRVSDPAGFTAAMAAGESWSGATRKFAIARDFWPGWRLIAGL